MLKKYFSKYVEDAIIGSFLAIAFYFISIAMVIQSSLYFGYELFSTTSIVVAIIVCSINYYIAHRLLSIEGDNT